jgi:hypothetical protein
MKLIVIRLDLDRCERDMIERFVCDGIISVGEALEVMVMKDMSEYDKVMWVRWIQKKRVG